MKHQINNLVRASRAYFHKLGIIASMEDIQADVAEILSDKLNIPFIQAMNYVKQHTEG